MTPAARLAAAIEVLSDIDTRRRPAADALKDWGLAHRFAGSGDRGAIASLVYDGLRVKASASALMGDDAPRAVLLGALRRLRGLDGAAIVALCDGSKFAPAPLTTTETGRLSLDPVAALEGQPDHIRGDFPEWLQPRLSTSFGDDLVAEMQALAARAPLDLRVNGLKALRPAAKAMLTHLSPVETPHSPFGLRLSPNQDGRLPSLQGEPAYLKGLVEIQDEGSQLVAQGAGATPGEQVLDLCAGAGGKTLALAALMNNRGQIYAADSDARRLAPIHERLERAGLRNVQVRTPRGRAMPLDDLEGRMDLVVIDAPCTGTGTWRRNPDAKWRMRSGALDERLKEQAQILDNASRFVKPGGRIAYITCSVLQDENGDQVRRIASEKDLIVEPPSAASLPLSVNEADGVLLTPRRTGTDGFFLSILRKGS
jgi:16S rRNA (cytosine967-C5)-methyltransferase